MTEAAAAMLRRDPRIAAATPVGNDGPDGSALLVEPAAAWFAEQRGEASRLRDRMLRTWEATYDAAHRRDPARNGAAPDFIGWSGSFDGAPIPDAVLRNWLAATAALLSSLPHERVREIGCGNGLLVAALAPRCRCYEASDLSGAAIERLRSWLATRSDLDHVVTSHRAAHAAPPDADPVDLVVLNSVAQYFPDRDYLDAVLARAWDGLRPGGHVVVADVRLLGPLPALAAAVATARAGEGDTAAAVRRRMRAAWLAQGELLLDPAFFHEFARARGGTVRVRLKPGRDRDEMTRYRCDAVLGRPAETATGPAAVAPTKLAAAAPTELADVRALRRWLDATRDGRAVLRGLPNARLAADLALHRALAGAAPATTVAELSAAARCRAGDAVDPAGIEALCAAAGRSCAVLAAPFRSDGAFDAWIGGEDGVPDAAGATGGRPTASDPPLMHGLRRLVARLHAELARELPEGARPHRIVPVLPPGADAAMSGWGFGNGWEC